MLKGHLENSMKSFDAQGTDTEGTGDGEASLAALLG